jgi:hypothetical protein
MYVYVLSLVEVTVSITTVELMTGIGELVVVARTDVTDNELGKFSEEDSVFM